MTLGEIEWGPWVERKDSSKPRVPGNTPVCVMFADGRENCDLRVECWIWNAYVTHYRLPANQSDTDTDTDAAIAALLAAGWTRNDAGDLIQPDPDEAMRPYLAELYQGRGYVERACRMRKGVNFDVMDRQYAKGLRAVLDLHARSQSAA